MADRESESSISLILTCRGISGIGDIGKGLLDSVTSNELNLIAPESDKSCFVLT